MSAEWFEAAEMMLLKGVCRHNVVITTALIPGKPACAYQESMVDAMLQVLRLILPQVTSNVEITKKDEVYKYNDKVTVIDTKACADGQHRQHYV